MKRDERRQMTMKMLVEQGSISLEKLADEFAVSKMTIHRDLDDLETAGLLRKIRGGASIESSTQFEADFQFRKQRAVREKFSIARKALSLIEPGMTVVLNDGTTAGLLGELLHEKRPLTVVTNNTAAIATLMHQNGITLITIGGTYSRKFNGFFGIIAEESLTRIRADISFLSSPAVDGSITFHMDEQVIRTKRLMMAAANRSYLMVDDQKFGKSALHHFADLSEFSGVIVNDGLSQITVNELTRQGVTLIQAGEKMHG